MSEIEKNALFDKAAFIESEKKQAFEKIASAASIRQRAYSSPYLTLGDMNLPEDQTIMFKWCKYFYTFDPVIHGAITAQSVFPVTSLTLEESNAFNAKANAAIESAEEDDEPGSVKKESSMMESVKYLLHHRINIYRLLIEIGIDYHLYGNCIILGETSKNDTTGDMEWKSIKRLPINSVVIELDANGKNIYKWNPPDHIKRAVLHGTEADKQGIPEIIKKAILDRKGIILNNERVFHFKLASDSYMESAWSMPGIASVLKLIMYKNTLRQAQEAIAREHIVPLRIFYIDPGQTGSGIAHIPGSANSTQAPASPSRMLAAEIEKTANDPNYKIVSNLPVGMVTAGGHGRGLLLTPEIDQIQGEILAGLGLPKEFIFGGVSYSGSSISLRIVENNFSTYRLLLTDFINNFIIKGLYKIRGKWHSEKDNANLIKASFTELKMQDDIQMKQQFINLQAQGLIPKALVYNALDLDPERIEEMIKAEAVRQSNLEKTIAIAKIETDLEVQKASVVAQKALEQFQQKMGIFMTDKTDFDFSNEYVRKILADVEKYTSGKALQIETERQVQTEQIQSQVDQNVLSIANEIVDQYIADNAYGESLWDMMSLNFKESPDKYSQLLSNMYDIIESAHADDARLQGFMERLLSEMAGRGLLQERMSAVMATQDPNAQQQQEAAPPDPNAVQDPSIAAQGNQQQGQPQQGIDMRPYPEQRPPRRETLG